MILRNNLDKVNYSALINEEFHLFLCILYVIFLLAEEFNKESSYSSVDLLCFAGFQSVNLIHNI